MAKSKIEIEKEENTSSILRSMKIDRSSPFYKVIFKDLMKLRANTLIHLSMFSVKRK